MKYTEGYIFYFDKEAWDPSIALPVPANVCHDFIAMSGYRKVNGSKHKSVFINLTWAI